MLRRNTRARVALLASEMTTRGGIQSFLGRLAQVVADEALIRGWDVFCLSLNDTTHLLTGTLPPGTRAWGAGGSKIRFVMRLIFLRKRTDLLFVGHVGLVPLALMLKSCGRIGAYCVQLYGIEAWRRLRFWQRWALRRADSIIAISSYTAHECARYNQIPASRITVIPLCAAETKHNRPHEFKLKGGLKLLCVARQATTERAKGFEVLFAALGGVKENHPDVHLNLVGSGDDQLRLRRIVDDAGLGRNVTFWGQLSDSDLAAAYDDCDVFVMPSRKEGFGIVFLEAMRAGKPCIGGLHGGTPEVIEEQVSGYLVPFGDVEALTARISDLAGDPILRRRMGERGRELISTRFSQRAFAVAYAAELVKAMTPRMRAPGEMETGTENAATKA